MTKSEMLLVLLAEECVETAQRVSKAIRFGLEEVQEGQELTNAERIVYEFNDILAVMDLIFKEQYVRKEMVGAKKQKIEKYLRYSQECGTLDRCNCPESYREYGINGGSTCNLCNTTHPSY